MMRIRRRVLVLAITMLAMVPVLAQQRQQRPAAPPPAAPPPAAPTLAPPPPPSGYEPLLLRLSEVMGAVAFLSDLCGNGPQASAAVRKKMQELIDTEAQNDLQRDRLAGAYNRGVTGYQMHRACTDVSRLALDRLVQEGARLTQEIAARFGS